MRSSSLFAKSRLKLEQMQLFLPITGQRVARALSILRSPSSKSASSRTSLSSSILTICPSRIRSLLSPRRSTTLLMCLTRRKQRSRSSFTPRMAFRTSLSVWRRRSTASPTTHRRRVHQVASLCQSEKSAHQLVLALSTHLSVRCRLCLASARDLDSSTRI